MESHKRNGPSIGGGIGVAAIILVLLSGGNASAEEMSPAARVGQEHFQQYCSGCHGLDAKGAGPFAQYLNVKPSDLTAIAARRGGSFRELEIAQIIDGRKQARGHGERDMPVWGRRFGRTATGSMSKDTRIRGEMLLLVAYLREIQGR